jgi:hypothetical protein
MPRRRRSLRSHGHAGAEALPRAAHTTACRP